jgi:hypothetical protein
MDADFLLPAVIAFAVGCLYLREAVLALRVTPWERDQERQRQRNRRFIRRALPHPTEPSNGR